MFSGIIKTVGLVKDVARNELGKNIIITSSLNTAAIKEGDSIAVNGCCLTVTGINGKDLSFYISADTLKKTTLSMLSKGANVNLESALKMGEEIGGHMVSGHVDDTARVIDIELVGVDKRIKIEVSNFGKNFIVQRGSITVDGVSLTVAYIVGNVITLNIIPYTLEHTTLKYLNTTTNFLVNVEYDGISKHVYKIVKNILSKA